MGFGLTHRYYLLPTSGMLRYWNPSDNPGSSTERTWDKSENSGEAQTDENKVKHSWIYSQSWQNQIRDPKDKDNAYKSSFI